MFFVLLQGVLKFIRTHNRFVLSDKRDSYFTIKGPSEGFFKDRGSKFYAYAYPNHSENDLKIIIDSLKKKHYSAVHHCYAYRHGHDYSVYKANDDGEPKNAAGKPILAQIDAKNLSQVVVIVVRYFGGTKLGVGGMMNAYKQASLDALNNAVLVEKTINDQFLISFGYPEMNLVMRYIKKLEVKILKQKLELNGQVIISIRKNDSKKALNIFTGLKNIGIKKLKKDEQLFS